MITIHNLTISYNKNNKVIRKLNLSLEEGVIHGIVGLNGAGKTTLLNALYGLKKPDEGSLLHNQQKISKKSVAYLPSENFFYANVTGREYLNLFKNREFDTDEWGRLFSLPLDALIDGYSGGMKKKLALLGVLKKDKPIMILDEPFNGLDIESCRIIRMVLLRLKEKQKTILITSHIIETLTTLCDLIHYLEHGTIRYTKARHEFAWFKREIFTKIEHAHMDFINKLTQ